MLISPHQTLPAVISSVTRNLSLGERPVNFPVSTARAPVSVKVPSPRIMVSSTSSAGERFQYTSSTCFKPISDRDVFFAFKPNSFILNKILSDKVTEKKVTPQWYFELST